MSIRLSVTVGAVAALSMGSLLAPAPVQADNMMNWMNPGKWFNSKDSDSYRGYGYPGYGGWGGYPGYGWGGYPGYGGWGGYPGHGWGGYPGYGGWGYPGYGWGAPANTGTQQQAAPAVPQ